MSENYAARAGGGGARGGDFVVLKGDWHIPSTFQSMILVV